MPDPVLEIRGLHKRFGGVAANAGIDLSIAPGGIHALIGPNGSGKSTLIAQIMGEIRPDGGSIRLRGADISALPVHARARLGVARSYQTPSLFPDLTAAENVAFGLRATGSVGGGVGGRAAETILRLANFAGPATDPAAQLSHGARRQLDLAIALSANPSLLLLDEPLAGLGAKESADMRTTLHALGKERTIVLVEHDMDAVFALADRITVLVEGRVLATGAPAAIRADAGVRRAYLGEPG